jgi:hypothetical protein
MVKVLISEWRFGEVKATNTGALRSFHPSYTPRAEQLISRSAYLLVYRGLCCPLGAALIPARACRWSPACASKNVQSGRAAPAAGRPCHTALPWVNRQRRSGSRQQALSRSRHARGPCRCRIMRLHWTFSVRAAAAS